MRHRGKIEATINNAGRAVELAEEAGSLAGFSALEPDRRTSEPLTWEVLRELATTAESRALAKDLKKRGWRFVGPRPSTPSCRRWGS